jgi:hypothetical protein
MGVNVLRTGEWLVDVSLLVQPEGNQHLPHVALACHSVGVVVGDGVVLSVVDVC